MTLWLIEPQDPLIVRDGRPFNATPGSRARSLPFPFPSTTAGGVRTRAGLDDQGMFDTGKVEDVKHVPVRGPLLVELDRDDNVSFLVPAPADAVVFEHEGKLERRWLRPLAPIEGAENDGKHGLAYLVGLSTPGRRTPGRPTHERGKPSKDAPSFWHWKTFERWLLDPAVETEPLSTSKLGHDGPQPDRRLHVSIDPANFTGLEGALFLTSGLTFWHREKGGNTPEQEETSAKQDHASEVPRKKRCNDNGRTPTLSRTQKLALAVDVAERELELRNLTISEGLAHLGGERRLMSWRQKTGLAFPEPPEDLAEKIMKHGGHCRLVLLTPAYFKAGWRPHFDNDTDTTVSLLAAAVGKPIVVSGWNFATRQAKESRRLVPAGSVYFVKVEGDVSQWLKERWLQPLSDDPELARAGFGLTAVGCWDGEPASINLQEDTDG